MKWIREHKLITTLLSLFIILALVFVLSITTGFGGGFFSTFVNNGAAKVSEFFSSVGGIRDGAKGIFAGKDLQNRIDELEKENDALKLELVKAQLEAGQLEQLQNLAGLLNYNYAAQEFNIVSADVTLRDGSNWNRVFTIDRGSESGIAVGNTVIDGDGLVGNVTEVGEGWAKVRPAISGDGKLSFKLARDGSQLGIVAAGPDGKFAGYMLDDDSTVAEGDILISSGMGSCPEGIEIGNVKSVNYNSDRLIREIVVEPSVNFKSLRKVSVII